jgi:hypothetical protein
MKTIFFFFSCLALLATSCATQKTTVLTPDPSSSVGSLQLAVGSENTVSSKQPAGEVAPPVYFSGNSEVAAWSVSSEAPECPVYYTGNGEPAASSLRLRGTSRKQSSTKFDV